MMCGACKKCEEFSIKDSLDSSCPFCSGGPSHFDFNFHTVFGLAMQHVICAIFKINSGLEP